MVEIPAVEVRDAVKSYQKGKVVLNHMNMTVPKGTIYGLLGSSGCGKTSVLSCIVGLRQLDKGKIRVFGRQVPGYGIPGKRLGYMPQFISLYLHFTINEILLYFGRIYGMSKSEILKRQEFLTEFLQLPHGSKQISSLSGGQQRRTSLATVGLDPILRSSIWDHLCEMVKNGHTTVIVTTHYTEEVRRADMIGLMRNGRLLAENTVDNLLQTFSAPLLEDIVLELCRRDHNSSKKNREQTTLEKHHSSYSISFGSKSGFFIPYLTSANTTCSDGEVAKTQNFECVVLGIKNHTNDEQPTIIPDARQQPYAVSTVPPSSAMTPVADNDLPLPVTASSRVQKINSLIRRNCIFFMRNLWFFIILMVYPATQTALVGFVIGGDPKNMSIAVVNDELPSWREVCSMELSQSGCYTGHYSCRFLNRLQSDHLNLVPFSTKEEALIATHSGKLFGLLTIPSNYTQHVIHRDVAGNFAENNTLDGTVIRVGLDFSNYIASMLIKRQLYKSLESYGIKLGGDCGALPKKFEVPLHYRKPVYGRLESKYTEYVVPGALVIILFLIPLSTCGLAFVSDKRQGTLERSMAAGVSTFDLMAAFLVTDGLAIIIQTIVTTVIMVYAFDFQVVGSYILYGLLCILTGLCGQSWGFVLSILCHDEASVLLMGFALHFPMLISGGIIWPLEGIPAWFKYINHCFPVTASLYTMRSIVTRGAGITSVLVWPGFVILLSWIVLAWCFAAVKYKSLIR